MTTVSFIL